MSLLFDISTQEEPRGGRKKRPEPVTVEQEPAYVGLPARITARPLLGRLDGEVECLDQSCQAACHDITDLDRGWWRIECCFCGTGQWVPAKTAKQERPARAATAGEFRFPEGTRFPGLTLAEAVEKNPGCEEWLRWAAKHGPDDATKKACQTYLASIAVPG